MKNIVAGTNDKNNYYLIPQELAELVAPTMNCPLGERKKKICSGSRKLSNDGVTFYRFQKIMIVFIEKT